MAGAKKTTEEPVEVPEAEVSASEAARIAKAKTVAEAFGRLQEAQAAKRKKVDLSDIQRAKIMAQRLALARKREGVKARMRAIELNAKDLGIDPKAYVDLFGDAIKAAGL